MNDMYEQVRLNDGYSTPSTGSLISQKLTTGSLIEVAMVVKLFSSRPCHCFKSNDGVSWAEPRGSFASGFASKRVATEYTSVAHEYH